MISPTVAGVFRKKIVRIFVTPSGRTLQTPSGRIREKWKPPSSVPCQMSLHEVPTQLVQISLYKPCVSPEKGKSALVIDNAVKPGVQLRRLMVGSVADQVPSHQCAGRHDYIISSCYEEGRHLT